ncbi:MAG TPA: hypothetical protein VFA91_12195, partial [Candidatus Polarisedimenticolia bacterium]|nr:hypothetical protein [Candidatus Polarisedimenticolia bacterium]
MPIRPMPMRRLLLLAAIFAASLPSDGAAQAQTGNPTPGTGQSISCDPADPAAGTPLDVASITGTWTDQISHEEVDIVPAAAGDTVHFKLNGRHDWDGVLGDGKLIFRRLAKASEMDHSAPEWARAAVEGKLEWRLELQPRFICGTPYLSGSWFPGLVRYRPAGNGATGGEATLAGDGTPIAMLFARKLPFIGGVVVLSYLPQHGANGIATFAYPFPEPPNPKPPQSGTLPEELNPFAFSPYSQEYEIYNSAQLMQYVRGPTGRMYIPGEHLLLFVYGEGFPHRWDHTHAIDVKGGTGGQGLSYSVVAIDSEKPEVMGPYYRDLFQRGRDILAARVRDPKDRDRLLHADAMLVQVNFGAGVLPGYKDFTINDFSGNSQWALRFADDRALISFGRQLYYGESEIADYRNELIRALFLPERTFIEVKTEIGLPLTEIPLRVVLNGRPVTWNGQDTLIAKLYPGDPTKRTYRTALIELVEAGKPHGQADPGVVFLTVKPKDMLEARLDDEGLLLADSRPGKVYSDPAELGLSWPQALARAARADKTVVNILLAGVRDLFADFSLSNFARVSGAAQVNAGARLWQRFKQVVGDVATALYPTSEEAQLEMEAETDWSKLSGSQATELDNFMIVDLLDRTTIATFLHNKAYEWLLGLHGNKDVVRRIPVTLGDHAALLMFRDEFVRQMKAALDPNLPGGLMSLKTDETGLLSLRAKLQPDAWNPRSAWSFIRVPCPGDEDKFIKAAILPAGVADCSFSYVLDDDYIDRSFKGSAFVGPDVGSIASAMVPPLDAATRARKWVLAAMKIGVENYQDRAKEALARAEKITDGDVRGLIELLGSDCPSEVADLPCGYKALRPFVLPRMMRRPPVDDPSSVRLWRVDFDARYRLRTLNSFIAAVKGQKEASSADTAMAMNYMLPFAAMLLPEQGILGALRVVMEAPFFGTVQSIAMAGLFDYGKMTDEVKFALGASIVLGVDRLDEAQ